MSTNYDVLFNASYDRITSADHGDAFFSHFYALFIDSTQALNILPSPRAPQEQQKIIYKSFFYMLSVATTYIVSDYLKQVAQEQSDQGLNLPAAVFAYWRRAVLQTVRDLDPLCDEEVLTAWAIFMAPGLEFMRRQAELHHDTSQEGRDEK
ncbi:Globin [Serratia fonticola]|uniref:Globin n=1 Tax=Serratia fonticola TaxID=47917 RepID=A0ABY9PJ86_SERFO|nr:Globin [Serratia fonticola]WMT12675.1 Globin [Serratia fonticola]